MRELPAEKMRIVSGWMFPSSQEILADQMGRDIARNKGHIFDLQMPYTQRPRHHSSQQLRHIVDMYGLVQRVTIIILTQENLNSSVPRLCFSPLPPPPFPSEHSKSMTRSDLPRISQSQIRTAECFRPLQVVK
jgi:hypothetical protein